jgi:hypothetical protein
MAAQSLTAKEIATDLNIDPKALRKFIREQQRAHEDDMPFGLEALPGQGGRYAFAPEEALALKAAYLENAQKRARKAATTAPIDAEDLDTDAEDLEFEDLSDDAAVDKDSGAELDTVDQDEAGEDDEVVDIEG